MTLYWLGKRGTRFDEQTSLLHVKLQNNGDIKSTCSVPKSNLTKKQNPALFHVDLLYLVQLFLLNMTPGP